MNNSVKNACWLSLFFLFFAACNTAGEQVDMKEQVADLQTVFSMKETSTSPYQSGDIIFHSSQCNQSLAIQLVTNSPYSHVGILHKEKGEWQVFEAARLVQSIPLKTWIARGKNQHYIVKRLKDETLLTDVALQRMKQIGKQYQGKKYDLKFEWSDDKIYCSELVWKLYDQAVGIELAKLEQIKNFDLSHALVQQKVKKRYEEGVPLEQWVITPAQLFKSEKIKTVFESVERL